MACDPCLDDRSLEGHRRSIAARTKAGQAIRPARRRPRLEQFDASKALADWVRARRASVDRRPQGHGHHSDRRKTSAYELPRDHHRPQSDHGARCATGPSMFVDRTRSAARRRAASLGPSIDRSTASQQAAGHRCARHLIRSPATRRAGRLRASSLAILIGRSPTTALDVPRGPFTCFARICGAASLGPSIGDGSCEVPGPRPRLVDRFVGETPYQIERAPSSSDVAAPHVGAFSSPRSSATLSGTRTVCNSGRSPLASPVRMILNLRDSATKIRSRSPVISKA